MWQMYLYFIKIISVSTGDGSYFVPLQHEVLCRCHRTFTHCRTIYLFIAG